MARKTQAERQAEWVCKMLDKNKKVSGSEFNAHFLKGVSREKKDSAKAALRADWSKLSHTLVAGLNAADVKVQLSEGGTLSCAAVSQKRYTTRNFRTEESDTAKRAIGDLVAKFLKRITRSVFLGSGSSIYWVGRAMVEHGPYNPKTLFWTVNIALVSEWCEAVGSEGEPNRAPVKKISIPGGQIETEFFRYATMVSPGWPRVGIVVIGVDGCSIVKDRAKERVCLYANSGDTAANSNTFVQIAEDAVICCVSSNKFTERAKTGPGPEIELPQSLSVQKVLVTDKKLSDEFRKLFEADGWAIVTEDDEWPDSLLELESS